jgi:hypothetical protein
MMQVLKDIGGVEISDTLVKFDGPDDAQKANTKAETATASGNDGTASSAP